MKKEYIELLKAVLLELKSKAPSGLDGICLLFDKKVLPVDSPKLSTRYYTNAVYPEFRIFIESTGQKLNPETKYRATDYWRCDNARRVEILAKYIHELENDYTRT